MLYPSKTETVHEIANRQESHERGVVILMNDGQHYVSGMGLSGSILRSLEHQGVIVKYICPQRIWKGYWRLVNRYDEIDAR